MKAILTICIPVISYCSLEFQRVTTGSRFWKSIAQLLTLLVSLVCLTACSSDSGEVTDELVSQSAESIETETQETAQPVTQGMFTMSIDGVETVGSGIVFIKENDLHFRALVGPVGRYIKIDYIIPNVDKVEPFPAGHMISEVVGGDMLMYRFEVIGESQGEFEATIESSPAGDHLLGRYRMTVIEVEKATGLEASPVQINGTFNLPMSTSREWTCDYSGPLVIDCGFIE